MTSTAIGARTRRQLITAGALGGLSQASGAQQREPQTTLDAQVQTASQATRQRLRDQRTPNVPLLDQDGRPVRFYDDVMKDRVVVINPMYTICSNTCTPATRNLLAARELLAAEGKKIHFVSLTLTPLSDTPAALREYKQLHGIDAGWTFLTGKVEDVERVQRALGFLSTRDEEGLLSHAAVARFCDERNHGWSHLNTLLSPRSLARMIRFELV